SGDVSDDVSSNSRRTTLSSSALPIPGWRPRRRPKIPVNCGNSIFQFSKWRFRILPKNGHLPQLVLLHLTGGVEGQVVEDLPIPRHLEARHPLAGPADQLVAGDRTVQHDERLAHLPESLVGHTDPRYLRHRGMLEQEAFDLGGVRIEPADDEHVFL